jgi:3-methyladenine DNA glycosylase/8-oxoguanine DNA glycosylase
MLRTFTTRLPVDLGLTLGLLRHGRIDPTIRIEGGEVSRATRTPEGPASQLLRASGGRIQVEAWGPGAEWLLEHAPALVGAFDDLTGFDPEHPRVRHFHQRMPGLRMGRTDAVMEIMIPTILEQKVTGKAAKRSYAPLALHLPPDPAAMKELPYHAFHPLGVERKRAETIRLACSYADRLEAAASMNREQARTRLTALPGLGDWTAANVARVGFGDPDAVETGDYHLPNTIAWHLAGEERGDDPRMLELLAPFAGHRGRVIRLIEAGGNYAPKHGPRLTPADIARL